VPVIWIVEDHGRQFSRRIDLRAGLKPLISAGYQKLHEKEGDYFGKFRKRPEGQRIVNQLLVQSNIILVPARYFIIREREMVGS
jgi:hypothetical protein